MIKLFTKTSSTFRVLSKPTVYLKRRGFDPEEEETNKKQKIENIEENEENEEIEEEENKTVENEEKKETIVKEEKGKNTKIKKKKKETKKLLLLPQDQSPIKLNQLIKPIPIKKEENENIEETKQESQDKMPSMSDFDNLNSPINTFPTPTLFENNPTLFNNAPNSITPLFSPTGNQTPIFSPTGNQTPVFSNLSPAPENSQNSQENSFEKFKNIFNDSPIPSNENNSNEKDQFFMNKIN
jgi:hypothetical protein